MELTTECYRLDCVSRYMAKITTHYNSFQHFSRRRPICAWFHFQARDPHTSNGLMLAEETDSEQTKQLYVRCTSHDPQRMALLPTFESRPPG